MPFYIRDYVPDSYIGPFEHRETANYLLYLAGAVLGNTQGGWRGVNQHYPIEQYAPGELARLSPDDFSDGKKPKLLPVSTIKPKYGWDILTWGGAAPQNVIDELKKLGVKEKGMGMNDNLVEVKKLKPGDKIMVKGRVTAPVLEVRGNRVVFEGGAFTETNGVVEKAYEDENPAGGTLSEWVNKGDDFYNDAPAMVEDLMHDGYNRAEALRNVRNILRNRHKRDITPEEMREIREIVRRYEKSIMKAARFVLLTGFPGNYFVRYVDTANRDNTQAQSNKYGSFDEAMRDAQHAAQENGVKVTDLTNGGHGMTIDDVRHGAQEMKVWNPKSQFIVADPRKWYVAGPFTTKAEAEKFIEENDTRREWHVEPYGGPEAAADQRSMKSFDKAYTGKVGDKVTITSGPYSGETGEVVEVDRKDVYVRLDSSNVTIQVWSHEVKSKAAMEVECSECKGAGCKACNGSGVMSVADDKRSKSGKDDPETEYQARGPSANVRRFMEPTGLNGDKFWCFDSEISEVRRNAQEDGVTLVPTGRKRSVGWRKVKRFTKDADAEYLDVRTAKGRLLKWDDEKKAADFVISTDELDRDNETIDPHNIDLDEYKTNPVVCLNHDTDELPVGISEDPETGKLCVWPDNIEGKDVLVARVFFNWEDARARRVGTAVKNNNLRTASVSFLPVHGHTTQNKAGGAHYSKARLLEWSITTVSANAGATRSLDIDKFLGELGVVSKKNKAAVNWFVEEEGNGKWTVFHGTTRELVNLPDKATAERRMREIQQEYNDMADRSHDSTHEKATGDWYECSRCGHASFGKFKDGQIGCTDCGEVVPGNELSKLRRQNRPSMRGEFRLVEKSMKVTKSSLKVDQNDDGTYSVIDEHNGWDMEYRGRSKWPTRALAEEAMDMLVESTSYEPNERSKAKGDVVKVRSDKDDEGKPIYFIQVISNGTILNGSQVSEYAPPKPDVRGIFYDKAKAEMVAEKINTHYRKNPVKGLFDADHVVSVPAEKSVSFELKPGKTMADVNRMIQQGKFSAKITTFSDVGIGTRAGVKVTLDGDEEDCNEIRGALGKTMKLNRKMWIDKSKTKAWILKSEGTDLDEETKDYLEERGLNDIRIEDNEPPVDANGWTPDEGESKSSPYSESQPEDKFDDCMHNGDTYDEAMKNTRDHWRSQFGRDLTQAEMDMIKREYGHNKGSKRMINKANVLEGDDVRRRSDGKTGYVESVIGNTGTVKIVWNDGTESNEPENALSKLDRAGGSSRGGKEGLGEDYGILEYDQVRDRRTGRAGYVDRLRSGLCHVIWDDHTSSWVVETNLRKLRRAKAATIAKAEEAVDEIHEEVKRKDAVEWAADDKVDEKAEEEIKEPEEKRFFKKIAKMMLHRKASPEYGILEYDRVRNRATGEIGYADQIKAGLVYVVYDNGRAAWIKETNLRLLARKGLDKKYKAFEDDDLEPVSDEQKAAGEYGILEYDPVRSRVSGKAGYAERIKDGLVLVVWDDHTSSWVKETSLRKLTRRETSGQGGKSAKGKNFRVKTSKGYICKDGGMTDDVEMAEEMPLDEAKAKAEDNDGVVERAVDDYYETNKRKDANDMDGPCPTCGKHPCECSAEKRAKRGGRRKQYSYDDQAGEEQNLTPSLKWVKRLKGLLKDALEGPERAEKDEIVDMLKSLKAMVDKAHKKAFPEDAKEEKRKAEEDEHEEDKDELAPEEEDAIDQVQKRLTATMNRLDHTHYRFTGRHLGHG